MIEQRQWAFVFVVSLFKALENIYDGRFGLCFAEWFFASVRKAAEVDCLI